MNEAFTRGSVWFAIAATLCAALVSGLTALVATGSVLAVLAPVLFARFVAADFEGTLTAALVVSAGMALLALSHGELAAIVVASGGYIAAEISIVAARVHRRRSTAGIGEQLRDVAINISLAIAALVGSLLLAAAHAPTWLAVAALALLSAGGLAAYLVGRIRNAARP